MIRLAIARKKFFIELSDEAMLN